MVSETSVDASNDWPLARPGILFDMLGPDATQGDHDRGVPESAAGSVTSIAGASEGAAGREGAGTRGRPGRTRSLLAMLGGAVGIGAFVGSLVLGHRHSVTHGAAAPSASWLRSFVDWLPMVFIGFGCARLFGFFDRGRTAFRGLAIGAVFALSLWHAQFEPILPWLLEATAVLLGVVLGLHSNSARRSGWTGLSVVALAGAVTVYAMDWLPDANRALAISLIATLLALCIDSRPYNGPCNPGSLRLLRGLAWLVVAAGVVLIGCTATTWHAPVFAALVGLVVACVPARRLAIAMGATAATCCVVNLDAVRERLGLGFGLLESSSATTAVYERPLGSSGGAKACYQRRSQELQLRLHGQVVAAAGPDRLEEPLLAAVALSLLRSGDRVLSLGVGTGRAARTLQVAAGGGFEIAPQWQELHELWPTVAVDGPVAPPPGFGEVLASASLRRDLAALDAGSRQLIVLPEQPCGAVAFRATDAFQRQLRRVVGSGTICQSIAFDRVSPELLRAWLLAAARQHAWNGLYAVGNAAVLVSAPQRPILRGGFSTWSADERWAMHEAHLGGPHDLAGALFGTVRPEWARRESIEAPGGSEKPGLGVVELLLEAVEPRSPSGPELSTADDSAVGTRQLAGPRQLAYWQGQQGAIGSAEGQIRSLPDDAAGREQAQAIASRFLPMGLPSALLQAAAGVAGGDDGGVAGVALRAPEQATRCAFAMDPTFFRPGIGACPPVLAALPRPNQERGDLEDIYRVEPNARLVDRCTGTSPLAVALRVRFASRCARALCKQLSAGELPADGALALRELADPFVLAEIASLLLPAGRLEELLTYWRSDLPMPVALQQLVPGGSPDQHRLLVRGLRGHTDRFSCDTIAYFLVSEDPELCASAAIALRLAVGDRVPFDPQWPRSRRLDAASRLRALHNRKP